MRRHIDRDVNALRVLKIELGIAEIDAYAEWLRDPHVGNDDDRTALGGLHHELTRD